ncbi:MAG: glycine cleavage system aminomethyltransferase GcvT [Kiritimatiellia bacterium]
MTGEQHAELKRTPLTDRHIAAGARMAPFAGFNMPIRYGSIVAEHRSAREKCALFDTCHMGEISVKGPGAEGDLEKMLTCAVDSMRPQTCRYGMMCNEEGGILDDVLVYRFDNDDFMLVVNAGNILRDCEWISSHVSGDVRAENRSDSTAKLDIQGPLSPRVMESLMKDSIRGLKYYNFMANRFQDSEVTVSRTGYTGEIGYEVYCSPPVALRLWEESVEMNAEPAGLGARDTLRLEMGMPLYGHELTTGHYPDETGKGGIAGGRSFIGSDALSSSPARRLCGISFETRRTARRGDGIFDAEDTPLGEITSGSFAPSLGKSVAMGYLKNGSTAPGTGVRVRTERGTLDGTVVDLPFYRGGTARKPVEDFLKRTAKPGVIN